MEYLKPSIDNKQSNTGQYKPTANISEETGGDNQYADTIEPHTQPEHIRNVFQSAENSMNGLGGIFDSTDIQPRTFLDPTTAHVEGLTSYVLTKVCGKLVFRLFLIQKVMM